MTGTTGVPLQRPIRLREFTQPCWVWWTEIIAIGLSFPRGDDVARPRWPPGSIARLVRLSFRSPQRYSCSVSCADRISPSTSARLEYGVRVAQAVCD